MISNLSDLVAYGGKLAREFPIIADEVTIKPADMPMTAVKSLCVGIELPPVYQRCISQIYVFGVSLGYFALWPSFNREGGLAQALRQANHGGEPAQLVAKSSNLIIVGREEANLVCVGAAGSASSDSVFLLDVMAAPKIQQIDIAPDFEKFLLLVGNLHAVSVEYEDAPADGVEEMIRVCKILGCNEQQIAYWKGKVNELLF